MKEDLNNYTEAYETKFKFYQENIWYPTWYAERLCKIINNNKDKSILSLGIGHKTVTERIISEFKNYLEKYTVLEGSPEIIEEFKKEHQDNKLEIIHTYFEDFNTKLKYPAIEMGFVLEHVDDPELIIKKFKEILTPGGSMFIAVPNARSLHRLIGHEAGLLDNLYRLSPQDLELGHKRYFDYESITKLVLKCGMQIRAVEGLMLKPITGDQLQKLAFDPKIIEALFKIGTKYPEISNCIYLEATHA